MKYEKNPLRVFMFTPPWGGGAYLEAHLGLQELDPVNHLHFELGN